MLMLDSQILSMKWRIILAKVRSIAKTMGKPSANLCRRALLEGRDTCNGEVLLSECENMCTYLNVRSVTDGKHSALEKCKLKQAIWRVYNEEICEALSSSEKARNTRIPIKEREIIYLKRMNLPDARTWFRFRCRGRSDENRETCKFVHEVPRYHAIEAYQFRDMRVDVVIIQPP